MALLALSLLALVTACKVAPDARHDMADADSERGRQVMRAVGCGSCHRIPGVWPAGAIGPPLDGFAERALIAGRIPNRADTLMMFVRDAPAVLPGSLMPPMPISEGEARDVAAYLYTLKRD